MPSGRIIVPSFLRRVVEAAAFTGHSATTLVRSRHRSSDHVDPLALAVELHDPFRQREQSVIAAAADVPTWLILRAALTHDDAARLDRLTGIDLDSQALAVRLAAVTNR